MFLSILTPTRNYASYLVDALESVAAQGDSRVEHVVVDGASTDGTQPLLEAWSDRIRYLSEPDVGQSDALNKAASMANGEWLGWLNADEFYLPHAFELLHATLDRSPEADVIYGDCCFVDAQGRLLRLVPQHGFDARTLRWYGPFIPSCAAFIRASSLPGRGWDATLRRVMDWDLYLELSRRQSRFVHVGAPLSAFRLHDDQVTATRVPYWEGEGLRVRAKHGLAVRPSIVRVLHQVGQIDHGLRKLIVGGYYRQAKVRWRLHGADLRWFTSPSARDNVERLLTLTFPF
jgi:glycosyltransferase involved in cell wall biosynthesis